jgi:GT2 family glycosyltransferase
MKFSISCLIYKNVAWLNFIYDQVQRHTNLNNDGEFFFVANDARPEVLDYLRANGIPHYVYENAPEQRNEWFINNVYRAYNHAAANSNGDFLVFLNSDMGLTPNWLENLLDAYNGNNCLTSRLVESGRMLSGEYGIGMNFGENCSVYRESEFQEYARCISEPQVRNGGLYMPLLVKKEDFLAVGGYPEGNILPGSDIFRPQYAKQGEACITGDLVLMQKFQTRGIVHQTVFNSVVYHFQRGESDS